ncbi:ETC complex I subunit [Hyphobacterium sp.]|uniref:ETC complex I subunit n=1 Tax=Hyphobacterium sp. TaxID=2004662 RepID=UPI003B51A336
MFAKIYRPSRNAMQSGQAKTKIWVLEFEPSMAKCTEPLMGWTSSRETASQVKLMFEDKDQAVAYAKKHGIPFRVTDKPDPVRKRKSYAANFSADRKEPWSH